MCRKQHLLGPVLLRRAASLASLQRRSDLVTSVKPSKVACGTGLTMAMYYAFTPFKPISWPGCCFAHPVQLQLLCFLPAVAVCFDNVSHSWPAIYKQNITCAVILSAICCQLCFVNATVHTSWSMTDINSWLYALPVACSPDTSSRRLYIGPGDLS